MMIKNSTKKALLEVGDFTRRALSMIVERLSKVYYTIHTSKFNNGLEVFAWNY